MGSNATGWYGVQAPMFRKKDNILFQNTGIVAQGGADISPSFFRYGGRVLFTPIEVLDLSLYAMKNHYFPVFQTLVGYDDSDAQYGVNSQIDQYKEDNNRQYGGGGWQAGGAVTLKAKIGTVIALINSNIEYFHIQSQTPQGEWFWEPEKEVLIQSNGAIMVDGALLIMNEWSQEERALRLGALANYRNSIEAQDTLLRIGGICMYQPSSHMTHIVLVQSYIIDRAFSAGHPFLAYSLSLEY